MSKKKICPHCGASMMEYRHTFGKGLASGLIRLYRVGGPTNINSIGLTHDQQDNFQKLRYWGLVEKTIRPDGSNIGGWWQVTDIGRLFVEGKTTISRSVWTYRGKFVRFEGKPVSFKDYHEGYKKRPDYAREAKPRGNPDQRNLL